MKDSGAIWGEKADLWQMRDGDLVEAVTWELESEKNHLLIEKQVKYLLERHFHIKSESIDYFNEQFDRIIYNFPFKSTNNQKVTPNKDNLEINKIFDELSEKLFELTNLPLPISNVKRVSSIFSYQSEFIPRKHPLLHEFYRPPSGVLNFTRLIDAVHFQIEFQESKQWPDDLTAISSLKSSFLVAISNQLKKMEIPSLISPSFLDIFYSGFVFRCSIFLEKEISILSSFPQLGTPLFLPFPLLSLPFPLLLLLSFSFPPSLFLLLIPLYFLILFPLSPSPSSFLPSPFTVPLSSFPHFQSPSLFTASPLSASLVPLFLSLCHYSSSLSFFYPSHSHIHHPSLPPLPPSPFPSSFPSLLSFLPLKFPLYNNKNNNNNNNIFINIK